jgi:hypothetical protein
VMNSRLVEGLIGRIHKLKQMRAKLKANTHGPSYWVPFSFPSSACHYLDERVSSLAGRIRD